jgi:hypothetical protein
MRGGNRLQVWAADGRLLHADAKLASGAPSEHRRSGGCKTRLKSCSPGSTSSTR